MDSSAAAEYSHSTDQAYNIPFDGHSIQNLKKRKLPPTSGSLSVRASFPRKRSSTACQLCRTRKTKCDNERPSCSKCRELGSHCIYQDQSNPASYVNSYNTHPKAGCLTDLKVRSR